MENWGIAEFFGTLFYTGILIFFPLILFDGIGIFKDIFYTSDRGPRHR